MFDNLTTGSSTFGLYLLGCRISNVRTTDLNYFATSSNLISVGVTLRLKATDTNDVFNAVTFVSYRIAPDGGLN